MKHPKALIVFWISIILIIVISILSESTYIENAQLNPFDYARITEVDYKAVVVDEPDSDGKIVITERLTFDIHAASKENLFWELWRELPETYVDGVNVHYKVNSVKQVLDNGYQVIYDRSPKLYWDDYDYVATNPTYGPGKWFHSQGPYDPDAARYECVLFYVDGLYREEVVFEIEYEMYNAALRYNDCSDLYISLYSGTTINHLESFKAEILFPDADMPKEGNYYVTTYGTDENDFPVKESATRNPGYYTFYFEFDEDELQFDPYNQYIEFDLVSYGEDKHIFTEYAPSNTYSNDDVLDIIKNDQKEYASTPEKYRKLKLSVLIQLSLCGICILIYAVAEKKHLKSKYTFYEPTWKPEFSKEIPGDLDPNFAAALVFCKHKAPKNDSCIYSALLLSLARKRYIEIISNPSGDAQIKILKNNQGTCEPLTLCEEYYFNLLVRHAKGKLTWMSDFRERVALDFANTATFSKNMQNSIVNIGMKSGYFQTADYNQPQKKVRFTATLFKVIGILLLTVVNFATYWTRLDLAFGAFTILGICFLLASWYLKAQAKQCVLLTQFGEDEYARWRAFYNFLKNEKQLHNCDIKDLQLWEKYLVYATAFGLSEKINKTISIQCPKAYASPVLGNNYYRSGRFHSHSRYFHSSVRSGSTFTYSGGFSGGYGGGGRGGGGGGGGH